MSSVPSSTAWERQGTLFRLPRELRDEIYRYVVKGNYLICRRECYLSRLRRISREAEDDKGEYEPGLAVSYWGTIYLNADLRVLCVSKAISDEAMAMLYSESTFRIDNFVGQDEMSWLSSKDVIGRMMNIQLPMKLPPPDDVCDVGHPLGSCSHREQVWRTTLQFISRTMTIRKTLRIKLHTCTLTTAGQLPDWMLRHMEMLTRFNTIIVEASPRFCLSSFRFIPYVKGKDIIEDWESMIEAITRHLRHAWGPAIVHRSDQPDRTQQSRRTLVFHPQEHMAAISRDRAEVLRAEAETSELEAGRQAVGN